MTFSVPMSNFETFQVPKNETPNFRTFPGPVGTLGWLDTKMISICRQTPIQVLNRLSVD